MPKDSGGIRRRLTGYTRSYLTKPERVSSTHAKVNIVKTHTDSWITDKIRHIWFTVFKRWTQLDREFSDPGELRTFLEERGFNPRSFSVHDMRPDDELI